MSLMNVVLPDPVGPTMLTTWPMCKSMRSNGSGWPSRPCPLRMEIVWIMNLPLSESVVFSCQFAFVGRCSVAYAN